MGNIFNLQGKWILIAAAVLLFVGLGRSDIYILDEARNAQCGREMWQNNEWVVPTFNGELRAHKPPLHYFFMKGAYGLFGPTAFAARFFSAVMGLALLWLLWWWVKKRMDARTAFWTVASLAVSVHFIFEFRLAVPDPYLIAFITAGVIFFYEYAESRSLKWLLLSGICAGCAILSKGPVALGLPAVAILGWAITMRRWKQLLHWHLIIYVLVIAAVAVPWFWLVHEATNGQFTKDFFFTHNINRFKAPMEGHGGLFIIVPLVAVVGMLPLVWFAGGAWKHLKGNGRNGLLVLCAWMVAVFLLFFSVSGTKLPNYAMPCYPFLAVLAGYGINRMIAQHKPAGSAWLVSMIVLNLLLGAGVIIGLGAEPAVAHLRWWGLVFLLPVTGLLIAWCRRRNQQPQWTLATVVKFYLLLIFMVNAWIYPAVYRQNPVTLTKQLLPRQETVYAYKIYNPAYNFYLNGPVKQWEQIQAFSDSLPLGKTVWIITRQEFVKDFTGLPVTVLARRKDIFENPETVILKWR